MEHVLERLYAMQCPGGPLLAPEYLLHMGRVPQCFFSAHNESERKQEIFIRLKFPFQCQMVHTPNLQAPVAGGWVTSKVLTVPLDADKS